MEKGRGKVIKSSSFRSATNFGKSNFTTERIVIVYGKTAIWGSKIYFFSSA